MRKMLVVVAVLGAAAIAVSQAYALPCSSSLFMIHSGTSFNCKDGSEVAAFAFAVDSPRINTGLENIACEGSGAGGGSCTSFGGALGDGNVEINADWGNPAINGCPGGVPNRRIVVVVQANDGSGLIASVSGLSVELFGGYIIDLAHTGDGANQLFCDASAGKPVSVSVSGTTLLLTFVPPVIHTDCDPGTGGVAFGSCDGFVPTIALGNLYTSVQKCGTRPDINWTRTCTNAPNTCTADTECASPSPAGVCAPALWTNRGPIPADGRVTIDFTNIKPTTTGDCLFVGASAVVSTVETPSLTGFVQVAGTDPNLAGPVPLDVTAKMEQGKVRVSWRVEHEIGLAGFEVRTTTKKGDVMVSGGLIAADGRRSYSVLIDRSKIAPGKTVTVVSKMGDNVTEYRSAPVNF